MPDSQAQPADQPSPAQTIRAMRIIWAAMLIGLFGFLGVTLFLNRRMDPLIGDDPLIDLLFYVNAALVVIWVPGGWFIRSLVHARGRGDDGAVAPAACASGNIILWGSCEGVALFAVVITLLAGSIGPPIICFAIPVAVMLITPPSARTMQPTGR